MILVLWCGWLVGLLVGLSVCWLVGWLVGLSVRWLVGWLVGCSVGLSVGQVLVCPYFTTAQILLFLGFRGLWPHCPCQNDSLCLLLPQGGWCGKDFWLSRCFGCILGPVSLAEKFKFNS